MMKRGLRPLKPPLAIIVNPSSGGGKSLRVQLPENSIRYVSRDESDFRNKVREFAKKHKTIGICGGDSSLTIAAEELQAIKFRGQLLFLPAGSVNDFVLEIAEQEKKQSSIYLGVLKAEGAEKNFIGQANWGLGVVVNRWVGEILKAAPFLRPLQNFIGFLCIVAAHLLRREIVEAEIASGNTNSSGRYSIVLVSQIAHWAGGLKFCPGASFKSPEFEVVLVRRCGLLRLIRIILAAKNGSHVNFPEVERLTGNTVEIRLKAPQAVQVDGDIMRNSQGELKNTLYSLKKLKTGILLTTATAMEFHSRVARKP